MCCHLVRVLRVVHGRAQSLLAGVLYARDRPRRRRSWQQRRLFALLPMLSHRHWLKSLAKVSSTAMVSVEQANEVVAKPRELETEQNLMKDLFNRALRTSQPGSDVKLNFRQAERHMPGMFTGKATEYTECTFKMEAYSSTLDPGGKGGEILRAAATEAKDMDDDEVTNFAAIYWNLPALNSALASCLRSENQTTGRITRRIRRRRDGHKYATTAEAGNRVHLDSKDPRIVRPKGDVIPLRKAGNVFVIDLWVRKDATSRKTAFQRQA